MYKKIIIAIVIGLLAIAGFGCAKKQPAQNTKTSAETQLPPNHPSFGGMDQSGQNSSGKLTDPKEVVNKINAALDEKYPGDWKVSGTTLQKGSYTENNKYGIADEVSKAFQGSMVSIFAGDKRVSSTIRGGDFANYATPPEVSETLKSGKAKVVSGGSLESTNYQKAYIPLQANGKTVGVMTVSIPQ